MRSTEGHFDDQARFTSHPHPTCNVRRFISKALTGLVLSGIGLGNVQCDRIQEQHRVQTASAAEIPPLPDVTASVESNGTEQAMPSTDNGASEPLGVHVVSGTQEPLHKPRKIVPDSFPTLAHTERYETVTFGAPEWTPAGDGLEFSRIPIFRGPSREHVDTVAVLRVDPVKNTLRVVHSNGLKRQTVEEWQAETGALAVVNAGMYTKSERDGTGYGRPVGPTLTDGRTLGPKELGPYRNDRGEIVRPYRGGMILAQPRMQGLPEIALYDYKFDPKKFDESYWRQYTQMVQLPERYTMLLDQEGSVRMVASLYQANRTVCGIGKDGEFYIFNTEGGFFTLHNFGRFLQELKKKGVDLERAFNMDGGYEADMDISTEDLRYTKFGRFETYGRGKENDASVEEGTKIAIPGVLCVMPKNR